jgi:hypothetical protein
MSTPLQQNLAPSFINSRRAFSPSWLMTVTFLRSATNAGPPTCPLAACHAVLSSVTQGAISLPSRTNRRSVRRSITEIFNMPFLCAYQGGQIACQTLGTVSPWIPRLRGKSECCRCRSCRSHLQQFDNCASLREMGVRINANETNSHRKKTKGNVCVMCVFSFARNRLSMFSEDVLVEFHVRHDIISPSALQDRTLQHGASPLTMDKQYAYQRRAAVSL